MQLAKKLETGRPVPVARMATCLTDGAGRLCEFECERRHCSEWELERGVVLVDAAAAAGHHVRSRDREILHAHTQGQAEEQTE